MLSILNQCLVLYPLGFHFISMISHALCPLHTAAFIITEIFFYWSEFSGLEISTACSFQGVNFVQKFLGFRGSATDFFVFDFCLDLIIPVTWNLEYPPLWLWIFVYDYGKPSSKVLASQRGTWCTCPSLAFLQVVVRVFFFTECWMQSLQACASGLNSTAGSISCDVPCPAGYDCTTSPGNVTLCAAGTYSNYGEGICRSCPSGKVCPDPSQQPQVCFYWSISQTFTQ